MGGVRPNARENGQIRPSSAIRDAWNTGAGRSSYLGFQTIQKMATVHAGSVVGGMSVKIIGRPCRHFGSGA
jgi:hypothetical protein